LMALVGVLARLVALALATVVGAAAEQHEKDDWSAPSLPLNWWLVRHGLWSATACGSPRPEGTQV